MSVVKLNSQTLAGRRKRVTLCRMITGPQIRAARALLALSAVALAERAGVSYQTVQRGEAVAGIPPMKSPNLYAIQRALEAAGVLFIDQDEGGGPGVRLRGDPR